MMSAVRDQKQGFSFVFTNLYELYKRSQVMPEAIDHHSSLRVARPLNASAVKPFEPPQFSQPSHSMPETPAVKDLRQNLEKLQQLHGRLSFMLKELEDLVSKRSK